MLAMISVSCTLVLSSSWVPSMVALWPSNYDVEGVPPATWTSTKAGYGAPVYADAAQTRAYLYTAAGREVDSDDGLGNDNTAHYESDGRRKQYYWGDKSPASSYNPDGTQIPLYGRWGSQLTTEVPDPYWTPPVDPPDEDPDPEDPDEDTAPAALVTPEALQGFTPDDNLTDDVAALAVESATALVDAYTRGRHLDRGGKPRPGVTTVVLTVAARIGANPGQVSRQDQAGSFMSRRGVGFTGFTLAELAVLNRYRKRAIGP